MAAALVTQWCMERCQPVLSFSGTIVPSWRMLLLMQLPTAPQPFPQELLGIAGERIALGKPGAMALAVSATSDGCAKDRRGLRREQESSGNPGAGGCPPTVPQERCEPTSLWLPELPSRPAEHRLLRRRSGWQGVPIAASWVVPAWPGLSSSVPSWEHRG